MIRKDYRELIAGKFSEEGPGWLFRRVRQYLLLNLSSVMQRSMCGPALGTLMVTYRCNFDCVMCDIPCRGAALEGKGLEEFDTDRFKAVIAGFARLGVPGIGFTGGEPLLRPDIFELLATARSYGMIVRLNTNGYLLGDDEADRIIKSCADSVNISLDGARAATHDRVRNFSGAFERVVTAVNRLHRLRQLKGSDLRIKIVTVVSEDNIDEVPDIITLSRELGADCIDFIPRQPFASDDASPSCDAFLARIERLSEYLEAARNQGAPIENSPAHLRLFRSSFAGIPSPVRCNAAYNSLAVDCFGNVFPCVPWINWGKPIGSVLQENLLDVWHSAEYQLARKDVSRCRDCYLNCHMELNLLFDLQFRLRLRWRRK